MADDASDTSTSDDAGNGGQQQTTTSTTTGTDQSAGKTFTQAELDRIVADRVSRTKAQFADYSDLKKKAAAAMTEQERAVAEAEQRGAATATAKASRRLVKAEFKAAAGSRVEDIDGLLEDLNLDKFIGPDGEPDEKAIKARVDRWAPNKAPDFDGGARTTSAKGVDMNALLRKAAGITN